MTVKRYKIELLIDVDWDLIRIPVDLQIQLAAIARSRHLKDVLEETLNEADGIEVRHIQLQSAKSGM